MAAVQPVVRSWNPSPSPCSIALQQDPSPAHLVGGAVALNLPLTLQLASAAAFSPDGTRQAVRDAPTEIEGLSIKRECVAVAHGSSGVDAEHAIDLECPADEDADTPDAQPGALLSEKGLQNVHRILPEIERKVRAAEEVAGDALNDHLMAVSSQSQGDEDEELGGGIAFFGCRDSHEQQRGQESEYNEEENKEEEDDEEQDEEEEADDDDKKENERVEEEGEQQQQQQEQKQQQQQQQQERKHEQQQEEQNLMPQDHEQQEEQEEDEDTSMDLDTLEARSDEIHAALEAKRKSVTDAKAREQAALAAQQEAADHRAKEEAALARCEARSKEHAKRKRAFQLSELSKLEAVEQRGETEFLLAQQAYEASISAAKAVYEAARAQFEQTKTACGAKRQKLQQL